MNTTNNNYGYGPIVDGYATQQQPLNNGSLMPAPQGYPQPNMSQLSPQPPMPPRVKTPIYPPINGRPITSEDEIVPAAIPMDGSVTYFPKVDFSEIIAKFWDRNGTLQEIRFVPAPFTNQNGSQTGVSLDMVMAKLTEIETRLNSKPHYPKKPYNKDYKKTSEQQKEDKT